MRLIILGAGGYGKTIADLAEQSGQYESIQMLDDACKEKCADYVRYMDEQTEFYPAFGTNEVRLNWLDRLMDAGCSVATLVHPTAYVSPKAKLHLGTAVLPHAVVNTDCEIMPGCIINCGAMIDHGCIIEAGVHICLGAIVKADNRIPRCMKIEAGQVVENRTYPL